MIDVTRSMQSYRECARHNWNIFFVPALTPTDEWEIVEDFEDLCALLFSSLVLRPIRRNSGIQLPDRLRPAEYFVPLRVIPMSQFGAPVSINRGVERTGYWDYPLDRITSDDADMRFIGFFDFDVRGTRDFEYCNVRIVASTRFPDIVGRDALIAMNYVRIVALTSDEIGGGSAPTCG